MESNRRRGTLASIAAELGVSRTTVSNAYNRPDQLSDALREKILHTAQRLGYPGPDPMARSLRMRRVGAVGVLLTENLCFAFDDPASVDFLAGLSEQLGQRGNSMLVIPASSKSEGEDQNGDRNLIRQALVDGFVVYSVADDDPYLQAVLDRGLPTVICDQPADRVELPYIGIDDREAIKPAVEHLLGAGHRRIGILTARLSREPNNGPVSLDRLANAHHQLQKARVEGALEVLAAAGIDRASVPIIERHINDRENNVDAAREMLESHPEVTAVVCTTDTLALGVLAYARESGVSVPEQLSVTGFDGIEIAQMVGLTTVIQPNRDKGRAVGKVLVELIGGNESASAQAVQATQTTSGAQAVQATQATSGAQATQEASAQPEKARVLLPTTFHEGKTTAKPPVAPRGSSSIG